MTPIVRLLAMLILLAAPLPALAHATGMGPHHGPLATAGPYHLELTVKDGEATLYVTDHADAPIDMSGARAEATLLAGKTAVKLTLTPAGANLLKGKSSLPTMLDGAKAAATLVMPSGATFQARFDFAAGH